MIISIDGLSGTGKSTLASYLSEYFDYVHINTGLFYRFAGFLYMTKNNENLSLTEINDFYIDDIIKEYNNNNIVLDTQSNHIIYQGTHYLEELYDSFITDTSAKIAHKRNLRNAINQFIYRTIKDLNVVVEGRDCAVNIVPNAGFKILLITSEDVRHSRVIQSREYAPTNEMKQKLQSIDSIDRCVSSNLEQLSIYDFIYESNNNSVEEMFGSVISAICSNEFFSGDSKCE